MRGSSGSKAVLITLLAFAIVLIPNHLPNVAAPLTLQPATFYFHSQNTRTLNTITSSFWANTTQAWSGTAQTDQRTVASSAPGIWHYYSQPGLAGNVSFTGPLTFVLYFVSSSGTGGGTVITGNVNKITSTGAVVPLAVGSLSGTSISTTLAVYTITLTSNTYQIETGAIFDFQVTVTVGGSTARTISLYYDFGSDPSQVSVTFQQRIGINFYSSVNQTGTSTTFFSRNWTIAGRQVTLRASLFDDLGVYDIASARANLTSPAGSTLLSNSPLTRVQGSAQNFTGLWSLNWTYSSNSLSGIYISRLAATDNSGVSMALVLSYTIFATWFLNLQAVSLDPGPVPVPGASVTLFVGAVPVYTGASDSSGWVSPQNIPLRDNATYNIKAFWQGSLVNQTTNYNPTSSLTIPLYLSVYRLDFSTRFLDGSANTLPQPPAAIQLAFPNGTSAALDPSRAYLLPAGTYSISSVTWKGINVAVSSITFNPKIGLTPVSLQIYDLTIVVVDPNGQAVSGATVTLTLAGQTITQNTTGNTGVLLFHALPKGQYVVGVTSQSQTVRNTVDLSQTSSSKIQFTATPASPSWVTQSLNWILLGAAVGGALGYGQFYRMKHPFREEPFEYLDKLTAGGFRDGDTVLIEGDTSSGKTTLCEEIAYKSLQSAHPVVFLTYDNPDIVKQTMKTMHWDTSKDEAQGFFQLVGCEITKIQKVDNSLGVLENFYDTTVLDMTISSGLAEVNGEKPTLIVDSAYQLVERASLHGLTNLILETSTNLKKQKGRFFLAVSRTASKSALVELEGVMDCVLELSTANEAGHMFTKLTVKKMRGRKFDNRAVKVRIHPGKGIVFQVPKSHKQKPSRPN
jgi:KaiC/GvpD/RAD55 family RecA-like ATPase